LFYTNEFAELLFFQWTGLTLFKILSDKQMKVINKLTNFLHAYKMTYIGGLLLNYLPQTIILNDLAMPALLFLAGSNMVQTESPKTYQIW
jgi:hypothetical protein